jgi:O-methyltransferase involved in polyketide biosynthesis
MIGLNNILELSSGFSFRGLQRVLYEDTIYIDTDLPDIITMKETLLRPLLRTLSEAPLGQLLLRPLNALDQAAFEELVRRFPPGPLALVNEGLLVYLDEKEKRRLCAIIRNLLQERGGYWITADIYVRKKEEELAFVGAVSPTISKFLADHHVDENKFDSFAGAESFFLSCGLKIAYKAEPDYDSLRSMEILKERTGKSPNLPFITRHRIRETWIMEVAD